MKNSEFYEDLYEKLYQVGYHNDDTCHTLNLFKYIDQALIEKTKIAKFYKLKSSSVIPKYLKFIVLKTASIWLNLLKSRKNYSHIRILDVGCSHGLAVKVLKDYGFDAYGIDVAPTAIDLCVTKNKLNCCQLGSATKIPFSDNYFDLIISSDTLEHLLPKDMNLMASEFKRVSRGACLLAIALDPEGNKTYLDSVKSTFGSHLELDSLHTCLKSIEEWDACFNSSGFSETVKLSEKNCLYEVIYR
jgi:2-polyprenyl-3-methyl-5-hydroxy-6-metoxy-1,4-benzoquinol methylase